MREPLISTASQKGGFRTLPFIIANEAFERTASYGLVPNMILYLTKQYGLENAQGANVLFIWAAVINFTPILGAFLADSYVGRFRMIGFGSVGSLLGMVMLWLTTMIPQAQPPRCGHSTQNCKLATTPQLLFLYFSFGLISIGAGALRSSSLAFGADQLVKRDDSFENRSMSESFFSWYYIFVSTSVIFSMTCIVYIQESLGWKVGFGVPVILMILSTLSFFLASPMYFKAEPKASLLIGLAQVIVASYKNRSIQLPHQSFSIGVLYHSNGSNLLEPSEKLRFLNKACIIKNPEIDLTPDGRASDPWHLCTVDQVEELKAVIKVIPILSTGMIMYVTIAQSSFPVLQAATMDRHITRSFEIPAGSIGVFTVISLVGWVAIYDRIIIPLASKIREKPGHLRLKQRMGIGILCSSASSAAIAVVESVRRETAIKEGYSDNPNGVVDMSVMWLLPHYLLAGLSEAFFAISQNEFFYTELPKTMSSIASTLVGVAMSAANLISSFIMSTIDDITKRAGEESWVSSNINEGHYDYYYWVLTVLTSLNFMYYLACCKAYGPCKGEKTQGFVGEEGMGDDY